MNLSGIVVAARPEHLGEVVHHLNAMPGIEVYAEDRESGRLVVVQEAVDIEQEVAGLKKIRELPNVSMALTFSLGTGHFQENDVVLNLSLDPTFLLVTIFPEGEGHQFVMA